MLYKCEINLSPFYRWMTCYNAACVYLFIFRPLTNVTIYICLCSECASFNSYNMSGYEVTKISKKEFQDFRETQSLMES
jgi:hypothetical protein